LLVNGTSTIVGAVSIEDGNLTWNASSQIFVTLEDEGLLRGTGTLSEAIVEGGAVWPGTGNLPGILTVSVDARFFGGAFKVDLDGVTPGTEYGQLEVEGVVDLGTATQLFLELGFAPTPGQSFTIIRNRENDPVVGHFFGLPEGAEFKFEGFTWKITYTGGTGNDVVVTVLRQTTANLSASLLAQPSTAAPGALLTYTAGVSNAGPDTADSPRITLGMPEGTTFVSVTAPEGWTCVLPPPTGPASVNCTGPSLGVGESANITVVVRVDLDAAGTISATATAFSPTNDPLSAGNSVTIFIPVGEPDPRPYKLFVAMVARS